MNIHVAIVQAMDDMGIRQPPQVVEFCKLVEEKLQADNSGSPKCRQHSSRFYNVEICPDCGEILSDISKLLADAPKSINESPNSGEAATDNRFINPLDVLAILNFMENHNARDELKKTFENICSQKNE